MQNNTGRRVAWSLAAAALLGLLGGCGAPSASPPPAHKKSSSSAARQRSHASSPWLSYNSATKTATLKMVAGYNGALSGFNFDGYGKGKLVVSVPAGWNVVVNFSNKGQLPHSLAVVTSHTGTTLAFPGASLPSADLTSGLAVGTTATFHFTPSTPGTYYLACLVYGHESLGMWDVLKVTSGGTPSISP